MRKDISKQSNRHFKPATLSHNLNSKKIDSHMSKHYDQNVFSRSIHLVMKLVTNIIADLQ